MRVTSEFWVSALIRRIQKDGGFAAVIRRGATEAGAIFLVQRTRLGDLLLYGPAPQADYDEARPMERRFALLVRSHSQSDIDVRLEREMRFDPDVWIVELEVEETMLSGMVEITTL
ncbi:MAG: DUF1491 family protein [Rhizobiaceae bacterium]|nr:DUF1491 family protein [Rhizobiaceae bacterium]